jgi:hypothetical protein
VLIPFPSLVPGSPFSGPRGSPSPCGKNPENACLSWGGQGGLLCLPVWKNPQEELRLAMTDRPAIRNSSSKIRGRGVPGSFYRGQSSASESGVPAYLLCAA